MISEQQSRSIDLIRFPLAAFVVFWHMTPSLQPLVNREYPLFSTEALRNIIEYSITGLFAQVAVPAFYLISGYLFFVGVASMGGVRNKIQKRIKSLLMPYLLWNSIAMLVPVIQMSLGCLIHGKDFVRVADYLITVFPAGYWVNSTHVLKYTNILGVHPIEFLPIDYPLWFIRDLLIVVLLSPLLFVLLKKTGKCLLLLLSTLFVLNVFPPVPGFEVRAFLFFSVGAYFSINQIDIFAFFYKRKRVLAVLTIMLAPIVIYFGGPATLLGQYLKPFFILIWTATLFNISYALANSHNVSMPSVLTMSCFFIYAGHTILILPTIQIILSRLLPYDNAIVDVMRYFLSPMLTITILVGIYYKSNKYFPRMTKLLSGGR